MVVVAADGSRVPLSIVGKAKQPQCFRLFDDPLRPPVAYTNQQNAWFDQMVTRWWLTKVFWKYHLSVHGDVPCILLLDNCSAQTGLNDGNQLINLHIMYFPPNMTSLHQPCDMGIIATLKVGYKMKMLQILLNIFDQEGGYQAAAVEQQKQRAGCKGIHFGGKATIADAMEILNDTWIVAASGDHSKYAAKSAVQQCWRKSDILPISWRTTIDEELGSNSVAAKDKVLSDGDCNDLCNRMQTLMTRCRKEKVDTSTIALGLRDSFVNEEIMMRKELFEAVHTWVNVEEDEFVIAEEVMEALADCNSEAEKGMQGVECNVDALQC